MRYIIECEDAFDILLGWKAINDAEKYHVKQTIYDIDNTIWYVKKTKTGYSARTRKDVGT